MHRSILRPLVRQCTALSVVTGVVLNGMPPLVAQATQSRAQQGLAVPASNRPTPDFKLVRQRMLGLQNSNVTQVADLAKKSLLLLDVAEAKTASERHKAIRRLPVSITVAPDRDRPGRAVKSFVAGGKTRVQLVIQERPQEAVVLPQHPEEPGPNATEPSARSVSESSGRWKANEDTCYWDAEDSGPDQCYPTAGRWKSNGQGGCYWDENDSGPNQCEPPPNICYYEEELGECASSQDVEDALILSAELEADHAAMEADVAQAEADETAYCNQHPSECSEELALSGPNALNNIPYCSWSITTAAWEVGGAILARASMYRAGYAVAVPATVLAGKVALAMAATVFAFVAVAQAVECVYEYYYLEAPALAAMIAGLVWEEHPWGIEDLPRRDNDPVNGWREHASKCASVRPSNSVRYVLSV
jgi:hypothetical protein